MTNPSSCIGVETDSIITDQELDIPIGSNLGEWGHEQYDGITYVQPGVYWLLEQGEWKAKYRGFDPGSIDRSRIVDQWQTHKDGTRTASFPATRFYGMGQVIAQNSWRSWRAWITTERTLRIVPGDHDTRKRHAESFSRQHLRQAANTLLRTRLGRDGGGELSAPHKLEWIDGPPSSWYLDDEFIEMRQLTRAEMEIAE